MPIRNPFRRTPGGEVVDDAPRGAADNGFKDAAVTGAKPLQVKDAIEYKLSEINDSGIYLPPSPHQEKPTFWHSKSNASTASSNHRSMLSENEPFSISRESFDSYRRSFDISARSPMQDCISETYPRASLDARRSIDRRSADIRRSRATPRSSMQAPRSSDSPGTHTNTSAAHGVQEENEEPFEDVGLDEPKPAPAKKRGIFSRFGDGGHGVAEGGKEEKQGGGHHFSLMGGRKRAESGGGAELKPMPRAEEETR